MRNNITPDEYSNNGGDYMSNMKELTWHELKRSYQPSDFTFHTTDDVKPYLELIGQESTIEAIKKAISVDSKGFNIYICGADSEEKEGFIKEEVKKLAKQKYAPNAIGYVYNFDNPEIPCLIEMRTEEAKALKNDLYEMIAFIVEELPEKLQSVEVETKRENLAGEFEKYRDKQIQLLNEFCAKMQMMMDISKEGLFFKPLNEEGKLISKEEYSEFSIQKKKELEEKAEKLYQMADEMNQNVLKEEKKYLQLYEDINQEIVLQEMGAMIKYLNEKYYRYPRLLSFFNSIAEDILEHLDIFSQQASDQNEETKEAFPWTLQHTISNLARRYGFNLIVTHEEEWGAPVIIDYEWAHLTMTGRILIDTELNMVHSDFSHIRPGLMHLANGGYLILHMQQLIENPKAWLSLKRTLITGKIRIEGNEEWGIALSNAIIPESLEARLKVILLGSEQIYAALYEMDEDFKKLFKTQIMFKQEISSSIQNIERLAGIAKQICEKEKLPPVTIGGILKLVEYGNRKTTTLKRLPSDTEALMDVLREAVWYAGAVIDEACVEAALMQRQSIELQAKMDERIIEEVYLIDTEGKRIGQVNGLAVYNVLDYSFGWPVKITATTYKGKQGIVDIEKQADLSGAIHTKGIHIITGFLGYQFAQDQPLSLSCNICFEQNYGLVDGDSASSAELYAILSSLGDLPICQNIATTGSVNQFGEIQPIGGVNEKIEGFFKVCKQKGLKGNEGVIIPKQNVKELILCDEVIEEVRLGKFHIYAISDIWEGIELMSQCSKAEVIQRVKNKLKRFNE